MSIDCEATRVLARVKELIQCEGPSGFALPKLYHTEQPIQVLGPNLELHSWFIPVTVDSLLVGFFELQTDLTLVRYSSFQRHKDSLQGCPAAELWINPESIRQQVVEEICPDETIRELFLSYDKVPSRLAWAVVLEALDGTLRTIYVAGNMVWQATKSDEADNTFGGR